MLSFAIGIGASWLLGLRAAALPVPVLNLSKIAFAAVAMAVALSKAPPMGWIAQLLIKPPLGVLIYGAMVLGLDISGARDHFRALVRKASRKLAVS